MHARAFIEVSQPVIARRSLDTSQTLRRASSWPSCSIADFVMADAEHFFQRGYSLKCFVDTIFQQSPHAEQAGLAADGLGRLAVEGHLADGGSHPHHFEDALAAAIAGVVAVIAAPAAHESGRWQPFRGDAGRLDFGGGRLVRLLAFGADHAHQTLGHDGDHGGGDQERLHANIDQTCNSARRIVRVQRTENQVSSQRSLDCDLGRLLDRGFRRPG